MTPPDTLREQNRRRLVFGGIAGAVILLVTLIVAVALRQGRSSPPAADASPTWSPMSWARETDATERAPTPSPVVANASCKNAQDWAASGDDSLLDGLINNQASGNISGDEIKAGCPQYLPMWQMAQGGIGNGETHAVPGEVRPGTYETASSTIENCYWERSRGGQTVANNFITGSTVKQRVTIRSSDDTFVSRNCGDWVKIG